MLLAAPIAFLAVAAVPTLVPTGLRCENLTDPIGIDAPVPHLSWRLLAARPDLKNLRQRAYRIRVEEAGKGSLLWDSGKVKSGETLGIPYAGRQLSSGTGVRWRVQTWDQNGNPSTWSSPAKFSVGLLSAKDWQAKWIAYDAPASATEGQKAFPGARWIWSARDGKGDAPAGTRTFLLRFTLQDVDTVATATMGLTVDDAFNLAVNGREVGSSQDVTDAWRKPMFLDVKPFLHGGENVVEVIARNTSLSPAGLLATLSLTDTSAKTTTYLSGGAWRERIDDGEVPVRVIGPVGIAPWGKFGSKTPRAATYYRRDFQVRPGLRRATAYVTALGLVDLHLNGKRVSEEMLTPGWTDYRKRVNYRSFDVTKRLRGGTNAVAAVLGDGWYAGFVGYSGTRGHYGDRPRVRVQLALDYADGHREIVATNDRWRASTGPILEQDLLMGEVYDARLQQPGWDKPGFDATAWQPVYEAKESVLVQASPAPGVKTIAERQPAEVRQIAPDTYIVDYGQNLAGYARLKVRGTAGQKITLRFAEVLNPDGTLYTQNLRGARATDTYICAGNGIETWSPRFTFHGFRYLEVKGLKQAPKRDELVAVAISTATPEVGSFKSSDPILNRLASNAWWTQKMNFIDVPTDCPQRDERLGWTGDAQAYIRTASQYSDVQAFFTKWLVSLDDGQRGDGQFPQVAPLLVAGDDGGPAWADAGVICPWTIYDVYGDKEQLRQHYPAMKKFVDFNLKRHGEDFLPPADLFCFGDWLSIRANTPKEVIAQAYLAGSSRILAKSAQVLGYREDAKTNWKLHEQVKAAFNRAYVSEDGWISGKTQCGQVLALAFDLLSHEMAKKAGDRLVADIESRGGHLSTGFVGTRDIMQALGKIGRYDVAFQLLHNTTFPSWGFEVVNGATTVWERWDGWTPDKGFQDAGMNSFAHYAYGAVMGWVFAEVGGIQNQTAGYGRIRIAPQIDPKLTWAQTSYDSVRGRIATKWRIKDGRLILNVEVPPNVTTEVVVPGHSPRAVVVGSGRHRFEANL